eukprot:TRINITY_DN14354_c1_g1_i1.p1 TRINITY_DN14354_c1_g1~~TRINITY_DN14354_c1_g1_i1.p1  ORF type:complete len:116 (+),score=4.20 TRINITY_DN14354_c1_g1_i1:422-769(+)
MLIVACEIKLKNAVGRRHPKTLTTRSRPPTPYRTTDQNLLRFPKKMLSNSFLLLAYSVMVLAIFSAISTEPLLLLKVLLFLSKLNIKAVGPSFVEGIGVHGHLSLFFLMKNLCLL